MAFALTHTGARAPVVALPGAAPHPIPQSRLRGRYPQGVVSLAVWKRYKSTDRMSAWAQANADYSTALANLELAREMGEFSMSLAIQHKQEMAAAKARMEQLSLQGARK